MQDDHYFSSCLSVRAPYFGALSDLPLLIFTPRKMHSGHHHINSLSSRIRQNGLKNQMLLHFAHYDQWERENLRGVHWIFLEFSYGSESHNIFFAFSVLLKGPLYRCIFLNKHMPQCIECHSLSFYPLDV